MRPLHVVPVAIITGILLVPSTAGAVGLSGSSNGSKGATTKSRGASSGAAAGRRTHIVRSGDSVQSIARRYGVSADSVRAANGIVDDRLYRGARLIIDAGTGGSSTGTRSSGGTSASGASRSAGSGESRRSSGSSYTVREGDYLDGIANEHDVSLSALLSANGLKSSSLILPGDELVIPSGRSHSSGSTQSSGSSSVGNAGVSARSGRTSRSGSTSAGSIGPDLRCPIRGASFMNDWGFPRDGGLRFHEGTDVFAPKGTTIVAPAAGTVVYSENGLGGHTFTLTTRTGWVIYGAHMSASIGSSRQVAAGEAIGRVGNSGNAAGGDTHMHMGLKQLGGSSINPYPSLRAACR